MNSQKLVAAWLPGLPHVLSSELNPSYASLNKAAVDVGNDFQKLGVKRILYYSTQWLSVLGQSVQTRKNSKGLHVDENWYDLANLSYDFKLDSELSSGMLAALGKENIQARSVDYEGFPIDTGTIVADTLINPKKVPTSMFACCVYSDYAQTIRLGQILRGVTESLSGTTAVVVVSGLSGRYFTTEIDSREDHIRSIEDDQANRTLLAAMNAGDWNKVSQMRANYCKQTKADMGLKALAFLEGMGFVEAGKVLKTKAYGPIYGTGAAVLSSL